MKLSCLIAVFLLLNLGPLISQNGGEDSKHTFYIQKWRKNGKIKCKNVVLLIKKSTNLTQYNNTLAFALKTKDELILR